MMVKPRMTRELEKFIKAHIKQFNLFTWIWIDILNSLAIACNIKMCIGHNITRTVESDPWNELITCISCFFEEFSSCTQCWIFIRCIKRASRKGYKFMSSWLNLSSKKYSIIWKNSNHKRAIEKSYAFKTCK